MVARNARMVMVCDLVNARVRGVWVGFRARKNFVGAIRPAQTPLERRAMGPHPPPRRARVRVLPTAAHVPRSSRAARDHRGQDIEHFEGAFAPPAPRAPPSANATLKSMIEALLQK